MENQEAIELAEYDNEMSARMPITVDDGYNSRYAAMDLAVKYMGGRGAGWPNLKQLATQIDVWLREGK